MKDLFRIVGCLLAMYGALGLMYTQYRKDKFRKKDIEEMMRTIVEELRNPSPIHRFFRGVFKPIIILRYRIESSFISDIDFDDDEE